MGFAKENEKFRVLDYAREYIYANINTVMKYGETYLWTGTDVLNENRKANYEVDEIVLQGSKLVYPLVEISCHNISNDGKNHYRIKNVSTVSFNFTGKIVQLPTNNLYSYLDKLANSLLCGTVSKKDISSTPFILTLDMLALGTDGEQLACRIIRQEEVCLFVLYEGIMDKQLELVDISLSYLNSIFKGDIGSIVYVNNKSACNRGNRLMYRQASNGEYVLTLY